MTTWAQALGGEEDKPYFKALMQKVASEREAGKIIYPPSEDVFNALTVTPLEKVKVVILGQDPYHGPHQAHGLCFSVLPNIKTPPRWLIFIKNWPTILPASQFQTMARLPRGQNRAYCCLIRC